MHDLARIALDLVNIPSVSRHQQRLTAGIADRVAALAHLRYDRVGVAAMSDTLSVLRRFPSG